MFHFYHKGQHLIQLKNLTIFKKLILALCIVASGFIVFSVYIFSTLGILKVNGPIYRQIVEGKDLVADILPPPDYIIESYLVAFELRENIKNPKKVSELTDYLQKKLKVEYLQRHDYWVNDRIFLPEEPTIRTEMIDSSYLPALAFYSIIESEYIPAVVAGDVDQANRILNEKLNEQYTRHRKHIDKVVELTTMKNSAIEEKAQRMVQTRSILATLICIGSLVIGFLLFIIVVIQIRSSLKGFSNNLKDITEGEGDLTRRLKVKSSDEIGSVSLYFNQFVEKLQGIIKQVFITADQVAAAATGLSGTSLRIAEHAETMASKNVSIVENTEESKENIASIASAAEEMASSSNSVATAIEEMSASLNEVARNCQKELAIANEATRHAHAGRETMALLGSAARSIGNVIEVINDIADQTNLLALNATIESASAGEAGKGFAVVASEVKELARQTASATREISTQIEQMQSNTTSAVQAIEKIAEVIEEVNTISQTIVSAVEEQSATINEIAKNVTGVRSIASAVSMNVTASADNLAEVTNAMSSFSTAVSDTSQGINRVKTSVVELSSLSDSLKKLIGTFKV